MLYSPRTKAAQPAWHFRLWISPQQGVTDARYIFIHHSSKSTRNVFLSIFFTEIKYLKLKVKGALWQCQQHKKYQMFVYNNRAWIVLSYLPLFKLDKKSKSNGYQFHKKYLNFYSSWLKDKWIFIL